MRLTDQMYAVYTARDEDSKTKYELYTNNCRGAVIEKIIITKDEEENVISFGSGPFSKEQKEALKEVYTRLSPNDYSHLFTNLQLFVIYKFTTGTSADYPCGEGNEKYTAYVDDFGNIILITAIIHHKLCRTSHFCVYPAYTYGFEESLRIFANRFIKRREDYLKFIESLNEDMLDKYFVKTYIVK